MPINLVRRGGLHQRPAGLLIVPEVEPEEQVDGDEPPSADDEPAACRSYAGNGDHHEDEDEDDDEDEAAESSDEGSWSDEHSDESAKLGHRASRGVHPSHSREQPQASSWQRQIWECLHSGAPPSSFACSFPLLSSMPFGCPKVVVEGVGQLALPLCPEQAATLRAVAEQAPYGKGMATVVDTDVRSALQVDACKVTIGSTWEKVLTDSILPAVAEGLGLTGAAAGSISAELYKLLLYERGGHFAAHRDTEKAPRMFATLVVQLPCAGGHEGGKLLVRHGGREVAVDTAQGSGDTLQCAAFYADCEHQLLPIVAGRRLVLAYNLCWTGQNGTPHASDGSQATMLAAALQAWEDALAAGGGQQRLALPLEHKYTTANLSFDNLKGGDRRLAQVAAACPQLDCHLVLLTRSLTGEINPRAPCKRQRSSGKCSGGFSRVTDVYHDSTSADWCAVDGSRIADYDDLQAERECFHPLGRQLFGSQPDKEGDYEEYTGNYGPTVTYIYYGAALVLWPRTRSLALACSAGVEAVLSLLAVRLKECATGSSDSADEARTQARELLDAAVACFEQPPKRARSHGEQSRTPAGDASTYILQLLLAVCKAGVPGAEQAIARLLAAPAWAKRTSSAGTTILAKLATTVESAAVRAAVLQLVQTWATAQGRAESCAALVAALACAPELQQQAALAAAEALRAAASQGTAAGEGGSALPGTKAWTLLLGAVQAQPAVQEQLALTAADTLLGGGDAWFATQHSSSLVALSDLLLSSPGLHASHYERFTAACLRRQECFKPLMYTLLDSPAVKAHPGVWQQLAVALADRLLSDSDGVPAQLKPASALALSDLLLSSPSLTDSHYEQFVAVCLRRQDCWRLLKQLLDSPAVKAQPGVRQQLALALAEQLLAGDAAPFSQIKAAVVLEVSDLLLSIPTLKASHYEPFVAACIRRQDSQALLTQLLRSRAVKADAALPAVQQLVAARLAFLQAQPAAAPAFSWCMPEASLPEYPQVEAFLRGPQEQATFTDLFNNPLRDALQGNGNTQDKSGTRTTYTVKAQAGGEYSNDQYCTVVKTREWHDRQVQQHEKLLEELHEVVAMRLLAD